MHKYSPDAPSHSSFFIPEFCRAEALFALVVLAQLFVLVLVLAEPVSQGFDWSRLALISLFVQWVMLLTAAVLCYLRPRLIHLKPLAASLLICLLVALLTLLCSLAVQFFYVDYLGLNLQGSKLGLFYLRNVLISLLMTAIVVRVFYLQSESRRQHQAQLRAQLEALQARIQPHFLFNTLNSIASLINLDAQKAELAILDLSDLLRASLASNQQLSTWQQEVSLARQYISIEQHRFAQRLQMDWQVDGIPADLPIPHLSLQPLLENAVLHGIQPSIHGGIIRVQASYQNNLFELYVTNPLPEQPGNHKGMQLALDNIRARLHSHFGSDARLKTGSKGADFIAHIRYPYELSATQIESPNGHPDC